TVSGSLISSINCPAGGFVGTGASSTTTFINCVSSVVISGYDCKLAAGFYANATTGGATVVFENCIFDGYINIKGSKDAQAGAFVAQKRNAGSITLTGCTSFGTVISDSASGSAGGLVGMMDGYNSVNINDCAVYDIVHSTAGGAGAIIGKYTSINSTTKIQNVVALATVTAGEAGFAGELVGIVGGKNNNYIKGAYALTENFYGSELANNAMVLEAYKLTSATALPETFSADLWTVGTLPSVAGASISFGESIAINVYAKVGIVLKAHAADVLYVDGKVAAYGEAVTVDGTDYVKFTFNGIKMADVETEFAISLISDKQAQVAYSMLDYITGSYADADEALKEVLVALLCYGDAAQETPTAIANAIALIPELETAVADFVEANYANVALTPVASEGLTVGLNLYGFVQPIFKVADSITKVTVEVNGIVSELAIVDGYAAYYDLSMLALNEVMTVTLYEGDTVALTANYTVANYIADGVAGDALTDAEKTLCKALAVFADVIADYANN
ncbi:MAG: hypothetical protein J6V82_05120, partial [Clostridia bacterium]|nr:hypothetical protein [Clostridia bacterium]